ncbi:serine protease Do [Undibacterium sp. GrIS 1.2]|uniref:Do family serine endopeptidase n=1 Tax=Undibacterium sp. GrIS 1.2 TaxID=3143933 RepID=UPI003391C086
MKAKEITIALVAAGVLSVGTANAFNWNASDWFHKKTSTAQADTPTTIAGSAMSSSQANTAQNTPSGTSATAPIGPITAPNYRAIVERYGSAVVGINTEAMHKTSMEDSDGASSDPFFQFFRGLPGMQGMPGFNGQGRMQPHDVPVRGQGSGFILSKDGLILTNAHVVNDADEVTVKLSDRREYKAKVLGSDKATDIAVLKIDANNLPVVSLGDTKQLGVGDYVLAIGSPFGFEQSATAGIVSAKSRSLPGDGYVPFIQTDVAVNPGNSGGPLFDASGNVVGINSQIYSQTGGYQGVSFAIPIEVALNVSNQIVKSGKVVHARLGVTIQELNQTLAESFKLKQPDGALVANIAPDSAAARAGLEPGDVILKYNDQIIKRSGDLPALVGIGKPGDKATLQVWRAGKAIELLAMLDTAKDVAMNEDASPRNQNKGRLGVSVRPLTSDEIRQAGLPSGLVVEQVGGAAARAGIEAGDVIIAVNGANVKSVTQLQSLVAKENKQLALLIQRGDAKIFVPVNLG